jgi:hypothetical protein
VIVGLSVITVAIIVAGAVQFIRGWELERDD